MKRSFKGSVAVVLLAGAGMAMTLPVLAQNAPPSTAPGAGAQAQGAGPGAGGGMMQGRGMLGGFDFTRFDADGDGKITAEEFMAARAAEAAALDANGDGKLTQDELVAHEMRKAQTRIEARVKARIAAQDTDGDGALSAAELAARPMPARMFERLDADGDGTVTTEEAQTMRDRMRGEGGRGDGKGRGGNDEDGWHRGGMGMRGHHDGDHEGHRMMWPWNN